MKKVTANTFWILLEKVLFAFAGIFVNVYVARYLGPEKFGLLGFSLAITALMTPFVTLGGNNILFNRIAKNRKSGIYLLLVSSKARKAIYLLLSIVLTIFSLLYFNSIEEIKVFCIIVWGSYFITNDIYQIFFNADLQSKKNTIAQNIGLAVSVILKLFFIKTGASVVAFALANVLQWATSYLIKAKLFFSSRTGSEQYRPRSKNKHLGYLFKAGLPLAFSGLSITLYTKTDQIMLGALLGQDQVGYYNSALTLAQGWLFIPMAIITSYMVRINESYKLGQQAFAKKARKLFGIVFFITLLPALIIMFFSHFFIALLYGEAYAPAGPILEVAAATTIFSALGTVSYRIITVLGGYNFLFKKMAVVSVLNIGLNLYFIPLAGGTGAALATLLSEILSAFVFNIFYKNGAVFKLQLQAMLPLTLKE